MSERLKAEIRDFALDNGFDLIGFTDAAPFTKSRIEMQRRKDQGVYPHGLAESNLIRRTEPAAVLPGARTIICLGAAYSTIEPPIVEARSLHGILSRYAWGQDYHRVIPPLLDRLIGFIDSQTGGRFHFIGMTDTGPLSDRAAAERAGLGFFGWNSALITPVYGSWVFLAEIITDLELPPDRPLGHTCIQCGRCMKACPTGAIYEPYRVNPFTCLSYITQMKEDIPHQYRELMGQRLFGCDTCQAVCPHNQDTAIGGRPEFYPGPAGAAPYLPTLLTMTKREFQRLYGSTAASWRGRKVLQRNAAIVLGNSGNKDALPHLARALQDPKPQVRRAAAWACLQIDEKAARALLERHQAAEIDDETARYIDSILAKR